MLRPVNLRTGENCGQQAVNYSIYHLSPKEWLLWSAVGLSVCGVVAFVFYRSILVFLLLVPIGILFPLYKKKDLKQLRLQMLNSQFKEGIVILSSYLSAGYSVENAFQMSVRELESMYGSQGLLAREFTYICLQIRNNRNVEQVLMEFALRCDLDDVKNFAQVFSVAKRSGGELVPILRHTVDIIHDKGQIQEEILTMTSAKRLEQKIMNLLPFLIVFYIELTSPGFFDLMYTTALGRIVMTVCLAVYAVAYAASEKILNIDI